MKKFLAVAIALSLLGAGCTGDPKVPNPNPATGRFDQFEIPTSGPINYYRITNVQGTVTTANGAESTKKVVLKNNDVLRSASFIEVMPGGSAELVIPYYGKIFLDSGSKFYLGTPSPFGGSRDPFDDLYTYFRLYSGRIWVNLDRTVDAVESSSFGIDVERVLNVYGPRVDSDRFFDVSTKRASFGLSLSEEGLKISSAKSTVLAYRYRLDPPSFLGIGGYTRRIENMQVSISSGQTATLTTKGTGSPSVSNMSQQELADPFVKRATADIAWEDVSSAKP